MMTYLRVDLLRSDLSHRRVACVIVLLNWNIMVGIEFIPYINVISCFISLVLNVVANVFPERQNQLMFGLFWSFQS